jgi:adenosine deaminase
MRYMEVRFAPALQAAPGFSVDDAVDAVLEGLRRGEKDFGVRSGVIICLYRPLSLEQNEAMLESAIKHRGRGVVGIDLAGDEAKFPLSRFKELYRRAKEAGLFTTAHAGEVPGSADLETALELNVDRLDHATLLEQRPDLLRLVIQRRLPIGVNLTSNLRTSAIHSYKEHPIAAWYRAGIPVMISTDDPGVFGIDLAHEFRVLLELGFTPEDLIAIQWRTIDGLFLPPAEKQALRARFETEMGRLLSELAASHS